MTHFCSLELTHTKNTICPGKKQGTRRRHLSLSRNPFIFPEPVGPPGGPERLLPTFASRQTASSSALCGPLLASKSGSILASAEGVTIPSQNRTPQLPGSELEEI